MKNGWRKKSVGEILRLEYGKPLDRPDRDAEGRYPVYGANGEKDRTNKFYHGKPSIIVGRKGSAGEINLTENAFWPLDVTYFVTFDEKQYDLRFLYYLLITLELTKLAKGVKPGINRNEVYSKITNVPSLPEQQRIVGILDEAFAGIATAKANAEKNLQNASDLSDALIQSLFPHDSNSPAEHTLEELSELIVDCEHKTAPTQDDGIPSIRTPNIGRGKLLLDGVYRVSESTYKEWTRRAEPIPGDLILAREAPAGNVAVVSEEMKVCLGQRTVLIRPKKDAFDSSYLAYLLLQKNSQRRLLAYSRGATVQHINVKDIRAFRLAEVPSLDEQRVVVAQVEDLMVKEANLVSLYKSKLTALDALKQSLLHQAFSGQL